MSKKKCHCKITFTRGGFGILQEDICEACLRKIARKAYKIVKKTKLINKGK